MIKYMVIGDPVAHSRSPGMQNAAFEFHGLGSPYGIRHVHPDELGGFIEFARANLKGVNRRPGRGSRRQREHPDY